MRTQDTKLNMTNNHHNRCHQLIRIASQAQMDMFALIAAILHLGNVRFFGRGEAAQLEPEEGDDCEAWAKEKRWPLHSFYLSRFLLFSPHSPGFSLTWQGSSSRTQRFAQSRLSASGLRSQ